MPPPSNIRPSTHIIPKSSLLFIYAYFNTKYLFHFSDPRSKVKDANQCCHTAEDGQNAGVKLLLHIRHVSRVRPLPPGLPAAAEDHADTCPRQLHLIRHEERLLLSCFQRPTVKLQPHLAPESRHNPRLGGDCVHHLPAGQGVRRDGVAG